MHTIRHKYNGAEDTTNFCDEQYLLCPPRTFGFYLPTKSWVQLWVDAVKIREPRVKAFNTLVLSDHYKNLIRSMVSRHGAGDENMKDLYSVKDIVEDKGMGVVILLHGRFIIPNTTIGGAKAVELLRRPPMVDHSATFAHPILPRTFLANFLQDLPELVNRSRLVCVVSSSHEPIFFETYSSTMIHSR